MWSLVRSFQTQLFGRRLISTSQQLAEKGLNKVQLIGRVGNEPKKIKSSTSENTMVVMSLGMDRMIKTRTETAEDGTEPVNTSNKTTMWFSVSVFKPILQDIVMKYVQKGSKVYVGGRLENSKYSREDGTTRYFTSVVVDELIHLQSPRSASSSSFQDDTYERESFPDSERVG